MYIKGYKNNQGKGYNARGNNATQSNKIRRILWIQ